MTAKMYATSSCEFVDDINAALYWPYTTCTAAISVYTPLRQRKLKVSILKAKFLVVGYRVQEEELLSMFINGGATSIPGITY